MAQTNAVTIQSYGGSLLGLNLLSGNSTTLLLSALGPAQSTTVTENNGNLVVGEPVQLGDGRTATVLGSGTAQPGINLLGLIVPTGSAVPLVILETSDGGILFLYPDGAPNALGMIALVITATPASYAFPGAVICFAAGTLIETAGGPRPVEDLAPGDLVLTVDAGMQPLVWVGRSRLGPETLRRKPHLRPIRISAGALGDGVPTRDLLVSPQHRILVASRVAERMCGTPRVLVAAKHLCSIDGIAPESDLETVTYVHILFDRHQIVYSNGAQTEALLPGPEALRSVGADARAELLELFPDLGGGRPEAVRTLTSGRMGRSLARRHAANGKPLLADYGT